MNDALQKQTQIIAVGNQKGGCCKSTNATNIAAALGELGKTSLIIDLDGNCGSTRFLGLPDGMFEGSSEAMLGDQHIDDLILSTDPVAGIDLPKGVELLAGSADLEDFESNFRKRSSSSRFADPTNALQNPIKEVMGRYDYIFLDTAPNSSAPTIAAYKSADWFILSTKPVQADIDSLTVAMRDIQEVRSDPNLNPNLKLLGVAVCALNGKKTKANAAHIERLNQEFEAAGDRGLFETMINTSTIVDQSQIARKALIDYAPDHKITEQYRRLAREVHERVQTYLQKKAASNDDSPVPAQAAESGGVVNAG